MTDNTKQQAQPVAHPSRNAVEHVIKRLRSGIEDPMWPGHAEVSKILLQNAVTYLQQHPALAAAPQPAEDDARDAARQPLTDEQLLSLREELWIGQARDISPGLLRRIARAVERAHGIGAPPDIAAQQREELLQRWREVPEVEPNVRGNAGPTAAQEQAT